MQKNMHKIHMNANKSYKCSEKCRAVTYAENIRDEPEQESKCRFETRQPRGAGECGSLRRDPEMAALHSVRENEYSHSSI